jgi:hypothetical protein
MIANGIGIAIAVLGIGFVARYILKEQHLGRKPQLYPAGFLIMAFAVAGFVVSQSSTITHIGIGKIAIDQAITQATGDAKAIQDIRGKVENQSATIDLIATQSSDAFSLSKRASKQVDDAEKKLHDLNPLINEANKAIKTLKDNADFSNLVLMAQGGDRPSYDAIGRIAADKGDPNSIVAGYTYQTVSAQHDSALSYTYKVDWKPGLDPSKLTFQQIANSLMQASGSTKIGALQYLCNRNDFSKIERLDFAYQLFHTDRDLAVVEYADRCMDNLTGQQWVPLPTGFMDTWWSAHRKDYLAAASSPDKPAK